MFVANGDPEGAGTVTPVDVATRTAGAPIPVHPLADTVAITPDGTTAFVGSFAFFEPDALTTIQPIDLATRTVGARITVGKNRDALAITPDQAPVAKLSVTPGFAGQPTTLDASASTVRFGTITSYA